MESKLKILIGSYNAENVQRLCSRLENKASLVVVDSWENFTHEVSRNTCSIQITDLNLTDCFPSVILDHIQEQKVSAPVIILLEDTSTYKLYRERAHSLIEILPINIIDDDCFFSTLEAVRTKYELLKNLI